MKKYLGALSALALFASVGMAAAEEATGMLQEIDEQARTITLDDGFTYRLEEGVSLEGLMPGQEVTVSYEEEAGQRVASEVDSEE